MINPARTMNRRAILASIGMASASAAAAMLLPTKRLALINGPLELEKAIPREFGNWKIDTNAYGGVVNPQTETLIKTTYDQVLTRTYTNQIGQRLMLSIAYGEDQTDTGHEVHHPEVCYPAQGFQIHKQQLDVIRTKFGEIKVRKIDTSLGRQRYEPVTYWVMIGNHVALNSIEKKVAEIKHGIQGQIVDGLLFRTSTIDTNTERSYSAQEHFIKALSENLKEKDRVRIMGLP